MTFNLRSQPDAVFPAEPARDWSTPSSHHGYCWRLNPRASGTVTHCDTTDLALLARSGYANIHSCKCGTLHGSRWRMCVTRPVSKPSPPR